jgi:hypothetical protein
MSEQTFNHEQAIRQYAELMRLLSVGAYDERQQNGSSGADSVEESRDRLETQAALHGLKFTTDTNTISSLAPMSDQERSEFEAAYKELREKLRKKSLEYMTHADFIEAVKPERWAETTALHAPSLEALLHGGCLILLFPDSQRRHLERSDVEALTRFLDQYASVQP